MLYIQPFYLWRFPHLVLAMAGSKDDPSDTRCGCNGWGMACGTAKIHGRGVASPNKAFVAPIAQGSGGKKQSFMFILFLLYNFDLLPMIKMNNLTPVGL